MEAETKNAGNRITLLAPANLRGPEAAQPVEAFLLQGLRAAG
jgi:hypothetical protein